MKTSANDNPIAMATTRVYDRKLSYILNANE